jgi:tetratricopeptide (TPR) repeat protein
MKPSILFIISTICAAALGCASAPGRRLQSNVHTFQDEQSPAKLTARGRAFAALGDTTRAREYFDAALEAGGDDRVLTPLLLSVCVRDGRYRLAIDYAEQYLRRHPGDPRMRFVLGTLHAGVGEPLAAEAEFAKVIAANPENPDAEYALAVLLRDQRGDLLGADRHFRAYLKLRPEGEHSEEAKSSLLQAVR